MRRVSEQTEAYMNQIEQQNEKITSLEEENNIVYQQLDKKINGSPDAIIEKAAATYLSTPENTEALANAFEELEQISGEDVSPSFEALYAALYSKVCVRIRDDYFEKGRGTYMAVPPDFGRAASYLERALKYSDGGADSRYTGIVYYLSAAYYHQYLSHPENVTDEIRYKLACAVKGLTIITDENPSSDYVPDAASMRSEIQALGFELDSISIPDDVMRPGIVRTPEVEEEEPETVPEVAP